MKSIKPGRGPSKMSAVGGIGAALFAVFWCILAASMGGWVMVPFGLIFVVIASYGAYYNYKNATSKNRYSVIDIVDGEEEPDPLNVMYGSKESINNQGFINNQDRGELGASVAYCPYCGTGVQSKFDFCPKCGKQLPN